MRIVVFGATGPSGLSLVQQALQRGIAVTALVRNPAKLDIKDEKLQVEQVNIFKVDEILEHIKKSDAVIACLGVQGSFLSRKTETIYTDSTRVILSAMRKSGKSRFIVISAGGVIKSSQEPFYMTYLIRPLKIGGVLHNMREMELLLEGSNDIDYTVVRPPGLTAGPVTDKEIKTEVEGQYVTGTDPWISRADVARFMLDCAQNNNFVRQRVAIAT